LSILLLKMTLDRHAVELTQVHGELNSQQRDKFVNGTARVPNDGAQERVLDSAPWMDGHDGAHFGPGMQQNQVAPFLPVFDKSSAFERTDHFPRVQRRKLWDASGRNRHVDSSLK
jgi:alpha-D-ribose 1-methylphosphonate 5-triphosphate synthase subunit PhnH